jgi:RNA polymerase sigma factor (sigma-70 family)
VLVEGSCAEPSLRALAGPAATRGAGSPGEAAFERLYAREFTHVHALIARFGVHPAEIEDLAQQVFGVALGKRHELDALANPRAWLTAVVVRVVHEHYRFRRVRRLRAWLVEHSWAGRSIEERTPETELCRDEAAEQVRGVLARMSGKLRDVLVLTELEGLEPRSAAAVLAIPYNTLRSRRRLARAEFERLWRVTFSHEEPKP